MPGDVTMSMPLESAANRPEATVANRTGPASPIVPLALGRLDAATSGIRLRETPAAPAPLETVAPGPDHALAA